MAEEGDKKASKMLKMIEEPTKFISTIQIGITLAGFLGSAFAADNFANILTDALAGAFNIADKYIGTINNISVIILTPEPITIIRQWLCPWCIDIFVILSNRFRITLHYSTTSVSNK